MANWITHRLKYVQREQSSLIGDVVVSQSTEITVEGIAAKVAPPAAYGGVMLLGFTPAEWISILTIIYLVMSIGLLIPKYWAQICDWYRAWKEGRKEEKNGS